MKSLRAKYVTRETSLVQLYALSEMVESVDSSFETWVANDVKERGMLRPLVVVRLSAQQWRDDPNPDILSPPNESALLLRIQCGNVRYRAAKALGYQAIDCVFFDSISEAEQYCAKMRKMEWV